MSFEWRKDEEEGWEEQVPVSVVLERPSPPYRLYLTILTVILLVGSIAYWQLSQRAQATALSLEAQVFSSLRLLQQAASSQDSELFETVLSQHDGGWASAQRALLRGEQYWGRRWFGLHWQPAANYTTTIQLSPDFGQAEVLLQQLYAIQRVEGVTVTVQLSQTAVFQAGQERWLLSAPDRDFWGETQTIEAEHLAVTFPARDRAIVRQLIPAVEAIMAMICQEVTGADCPSGMQIPVLFDTRPMSLYDLHYPAEYPELGQVTLPAPTLLGLPGSDAGVELLAQSYAAYIASSALPTISSWQGERPIFYQTIVEKQLNQWGLQGPMLTSINYESLANTPATLQEISLLWASEDFHSLVIRDHVRALIEFLGERGATAVNLQNSLSIPNFWQWANLPANDSAIEQEWLQFLYDHSTFASQPPPLPLPELDIRLVCSGDKLYRYDWAASLWRNEMQPYEDQSFVEIVPHDAGLIVAGRYYEETAQDYRGRAFWVRGEHSLQFSEWRSNSDPPLISSQQHDPTGHKLVLQTQDPVNRNLTRYRLLDLNACETGACSLLFLPGWPVWSPDGRSTLIMQENLSSLLVPQETQLWRGDADGQLVAELGQGYAPFWLDEQTYGYVRLGATGHGEIVTADIDNDTPHIFLTLAELFGQLPGPDSPLPVFIANVQVNPTIPGRMLITVVRENDTMLVHVTRLGRRTIVVNETSVSTAYSPDGRMIVLDKPLDQAGLRTLMLTYGLNETGQQIVPTNSSRISYDWTADSQWLLISHPGFLKLVAPGHNYFQIIPHEFGGCDRVEWVQ